MSMKLEKTLANCKPSEFVAQTAKIKKAVKHWMDLTKIAEIRSQKPVYESFQPGATAEEKKAVIERNAAAQKRQAMENFSQIVDEMLEKHPEETLQVLALCCFVEPENVDDYPVSEYLRSMMELFNDEAVIGFFTLLVQLGNKNG